MTAGLLPRSRGVSHPGRIMAVMGGLQRFAEVFVTVTWWVTMLALLADVAVGVWAAVTGSRVFGPALLGLCALGAVLTRLAGPAPERQ